MCLCDLLLLVVVLKVVKLVGVAVGCCLGLMDLGGDAFELFARIVMLVCCLRVLLYWLAMFLRFGG